MTDDLDDKMEQAKGRAEEATGDLTGRDDLRREGEVDEDTGKARQELNEAADKAGEALDEVSGKVKDALPSDEGSDSSAGS